MSRVTRLVPALCICGATLTGAALAEGNRLVLTCEPGADAETDADAGTGSLAPGLPDQPLRFTIEPVSVDEDGFGKVKVTAPDGFTHRGAATSFTGAFGWSDGNERNLLVVLEPEDAEELNVLWVRYDETVADPDELHVPLICKAS